MTLIDHSQFRNRATEAFDQQRAQQSSSDKELSIAVGELAFEQEILLAHYQGDSRLIEASDFEITVVFRLYMTSKFSCLNKYLCFA